MQTTVPIVVRGHGKITDDLGNVLLDKDNAIHPQNIARIIARALAHEDNHFIHRIAFGNGGTTVNAAFDVFYKTPNDGQSPDIATWDSRLYHETYSEIIDAGQTVLNTNLGKDFGSADTSVGMRTGGGDVAASDPTAVLHVSGPGVRSSELGIMSEIVITSVINGDEPKSQFMSDTNAITSLNETSGDFIFDEIGLFTKGAQAINTSGYQYIDVGNRMSTDDTGLLPGQLYSFNVAIDGGTSVQISFTPPITGGSGAGGQILYGDLCEAINTAPNTAWNIVGGLPGGAVLAVTDLTGGSFPSIAGAMTYGYLLVESSSTGSTSAVDLTGANTTALLAALNPPYGATLVPAVQGSNAGIQNSPTSPDMERERLLTHLIFSPVLKSANRTLTITYTLTISVARTPQ